MQPDELLRGALFVTGLVAIVFVAATVAAVAAAAVIQATKRVDVGTKSKATGADIRIRTNMTIASGAMARTRKRIGGAIINPRNGRRYTPARVLEI